MASWASRVPDDYRRTLFTELADLFSEIQEEGVSIARELVLATEDEHRPARRLSNQDYLEIFNYLGEESSITKASLVEAIKQYAKPPYSEGFMRPKRSARSSRTSRPPRKTAKASRGMERSRAVEALQDILNKNWQACRRAGMSMSEPDASEVLGAIERNLGNKPYTYRMVLRAARRLHKERIVLSAMAIANNVIDTLSKRGNLKVSVISTPTRR